jgi:uncharacterized membrane protein
MYLKTTFTQNFFRIFLGLIMIYIGIAHLTFRRVEFQAQVPVWITQNENFIDIIVIVSGYIEIIFGVTLIFLKKYKSYIGIALAIFFILIFPGNINQYIYEIDALRLDSNEKRFYRLLFQPVLVLWALWSSGGLKYLIQRNNK